MNDKLYSMRDGVRCIEKKNKFFLLSTYPLKFAAFSSEVAPILRYLENHPQSSLEDLASQFAGATKKGFPAFLYTLVKKGFLEEKGLGTYSWTPRVSVVIPVRNRTEEIETCLQSLSNVSYPRENLEIIVVDDGSDDNTPEIADRFSVKLFRMENRKGASFCRNYGAQKAQSEIVCFLDSDCVVDNLWLKELMSVFRDPRVGACGGLVDSYEDTSNLDRYEQVKSSLNMGAVTKDSRDGDRFFYIPSCSMAVRMSLFSRLGGFREEMEVGEDVDLCWRIIDAGHVIEYRPAAKIYHRHRNTLGPFCRRRFDYGTSEPILQALHLNREKTFIFRPWSMGVWILLILGISTGAVWFYILSVLWTAADTVFRWRKSYTAGIALNPLLVLNAVVRSDLSFLYHLSSFFSRYYVVLFTVLIPVLPLPGISIWAVHGSVGIVQFIVKKPRLNILEFLFYFSLDQMSYQTGVWFECFRKRFFAPVFPKIRFSAAP